MDKYKDNSLVEPMDAIVLINDNYADKGLYKGYIGTVMDNHIQKHGVVVVDFCNPVTGGYILPVVEIKKEDFRVVSSDLDDQKIVKSFKDLFKK